MTKSFSVAYVHRAVYRGLLGIAILAVVCMGSSQAHAFTRGSSNSDNSTTTSTPYAPTYVFPFSHIPVTYNRDHLNYPATDVGGCYARVLAPTAGVILQTHRKDLWTEGVNAIGTAGGLTITLIGDDTVRYFFAHLGRIKVRDGAHVEAGDWIGVVGSSGNARITSCHTHLGMSRICNLAEITLLQGEFWPWKYLDAWREGRQLSPRKEKNQLIKEQPDRCTTVASEYRRELTQHSGH